jgi:uncharacterized protein with PIN domain
MSGCHVPDKIEETSTLFENVYTGIERCFERIEKLEKEMKEKDIRIEKLSDTLSSLCSLYGKINIFENIKETLHRCSSCGNLGKIGKNVSEIVFKDESDREFRRCGKCGALTPNICA